LDLLTVSEHLCFALSMVGVVYSAFEVSRTLRILDAPKLDVFMITGQAGSQAGIRIAVNCLA
jgi:hypothetical protein